MSEERTDPADDWETPCPKREDRQHCNCWYDGEPCCACGDPAAPCPPDVLQDLLLVVSLDIPGEVIESWTAREWQDVEKWAAAVHLAASDNIVKVPVKPSVLEGFAEIR